MAPISLLLIRKLYCVSQRRLLECLPSFHPVRRIYCPSGLIALSLSFLFPFHSPHILLTFHNETLSSFYSASSEEALLLEHACARLSCGSEKAAPQGLGIAGGSEAGTVGVRPAWGFPATGALGHRTSQRTLRAGAEGGERSAGRAEANCMRSARCHVLLTFLSFADVFHG